MKRTILVLSVILWSFQSSAKVKFPEYVGFVNDFAQTLGDTSQLERRLEEYDRDTGNQIVVVTVPTSDPLTPQQYAEELFDTWKPGQKGNDNGIIILNAVKERRVVIRTGYGLEAVLPDAKVGRILDTAVIPYFKKDMPLLGLYSGAEAVIAVITPGKEKTVIENVAASSPVESQDFQKDDSADTVPCEKNPNVPQRDNTTRYIQNYAMGSSDTALLQKIRDDDKIEVVIVGVDAIPDGISGNRLAECIAQNWNLGEPLGRKGKGIAIVADLDAGVVFAGVGSRLRTEFSPSMIENVISEQSEKLSKPLAISESLPSIVIILSQYSGNDWEDITLISVLGIFGLGLIYLLGYWIYCFFRALFAVCPKCHHRFPKLLNRKIICEATTRHIGSENRSYRCRHCGNEWVKVVTLAKLWQNNSTGRGSSGGFSGGSSGGSSGSSGFGGFGGGSSGGGGADRGY